MKQLYHGSVFDFTEIDLSKGRDYKDFGKGFYATSFRDHAERIAIRNKKIVQKRQELLKKAGKIKNADPITAYCYQLLFDEEAASSLEMKVFTIADKEWLKFVMLNRQTKGLIHSYDIVIGPTADAQTSVILNAYQEELLNTGFADEVCEEVINELMPENLPKQYFFGTEAAIKTLQFAPARRWVIV